MQAAPGQGAELKRSALAECFWTSCAKPCLATQVGWVSLDLNWISLDFVGVRFVLNPDGG